MCFVCEMEKCIDLMSVVFGVEEAKKVCLHTFPELIERMKESPRHSSLDCFTLFLRDYYERVCLNN